MSRPHAMSTKKGLTAPVTYPHSITGSSTSPSQREINRIYDQTRIPARHSNHIPGGANRAERQHPPLRDVTDRSRGIPHSTRNAELCRQTAELRRIKTEEEATSDAIARRVVVGARRAGCAQCLSRPKVDQLTAELDNATLEKRHDREVNRLRQEVHDAQARLTHEQTMSAELKQRHRDTVNEIEQEHQQQLGDLRARMKELEKENEVLQPQHEKWEAQHALLGDKGHDTHRQEKDELVKEVKSLREDNEAYRASLEQCRSGERRERKTKAQYEEQFRAWRASYAGQLSRLREESKELQGALSQLADERDLLASNLTIATTSNETIEMNIEKYKKELQDLQKRCDEDVSRLRGKLEKVTAEKDQAVTGLERRKKRQGADVEQVEAYKQQLHALQQSNVNEVRRIRQTLLKIAKDKEQAHADLEISRCSSAEQTSTYNRQLQDLHQSFTDEISTLRSKLQNVTQEKEQAVASLVQLEANRTDDAKQISSYQRRLQDLQQRYDEETNRMRREHSISKNVIAQLVQERDQVVADLSGLEKKHESELYQLQIHNQQLSDLKKKRDEDIMKCHQERSDVASGCDRSQANLSSSTSERDQALGDLSRTATRHAVDIRNIKQYSERLQLLQTRLLQSGGKQNTKSNSNNNANDDTNQK